MNSNNQQSIIGLIEILNDLSYNIVYIDGQYYAFVEFLEVQDGMNEITMMGKNITTIITNSVENISMSGQAQNEMRTKIDTLPARRRVFSPTTTYVKYLSYKQI